MSTIAEHGIKQPELSRFVIDGVDPAMLDSLWLQLRDWLDAIPITEHTPEWIREMAREQLVQIWAVCDREENKICGVVVTEIKQYPCYRVLHVLGFAGEHATKWGLAILITLERFARFHGLRRIESRARGYWMKLLEGAGFDTDWHFVTKEM